MAELMPCKLCGSQPKVRASSNLKTKKLEYGHLCSNPNCPKSYFCIMYENVEKSAKMWNKKNLILVLNNDCKDCLYYEVCADFRRNICETDQKRFEEYKINSNGICDHFQNKSDYTEVKRGQWIVEVFALTMCKKVYCSVCGYSETKGPAWEENWGLHNFCPNCGAKTKESD